MNFIGMDNVEGYTEEVKQKLNPAAQREQLARKKLDKVLAVKREDDSVKKAGTMRRRQSPTPEG
jgi:hypothetical protein